MYQPGFAVYITLGRTEDVVKLDELEKQYSGTTLPNLVEKQLKSLKEPVLLEAIQGTYSNFPVGFRPLIDAYTQAYLQKWFGPHIVRTDLGELFRVTIGDIKTMASSEGMELSDEQVFDVFNLMVMRLTAFAHSKQELRKQLGIKKGWFS